MKAIVCSRFGDAGAIELRDVPDPVPRVKEVLIKIHATTVTTGDWRIWSRTLPTGFHLLSYLIFGIRTPRHPIFGTDLAGEVVGVGSGVTRFNVGDQVVAVTGMGLGGHAEYISLPETGAIVKKPAGLSYDDAVSLCFGGLTALDFLQRAGIKKGERVLVNGASGSVGIHAVEFARHMGAVVTAVCSPSRHDFVLSIGAEAVLDYSGGNLFAQETRYDVIMDCAGNLNFGNSKHLLKPGGRLILIAAGIPQMLGTLKAIGGHCRAIVGPIKESAEAMQKLMDLAAVGVLKPVIDRRWPLSGVSQAFMHVGSKQKQGNTVIQVVHA